MNEAQVKPVKERGGVCAATTTRERDWPVQLPSLRH